VRVFQKDVINQKYYPIGTGINGDSPYELFGWSLAMSADGTTFAVGAIQSNSNGNHSGHVRVFQRSAPSQKYKQPARSFDLTCPLLMSGARCKIGFETIKKKCMGLSAFIVCVMVVPSLWISAILAEGRR
jgi:hypothetical protein